MLLVACATAACGYTLAGHGSYLPANIKTVGIPNFTNRTSLYQLDQMLTQRVRSEFIGRGKYKIVPQAEGVDAVLRGEVLSIGVTPAILNAQQQASRYVITVTAKIEFRDVKANKVLWQNDHMVFRQDYDVVTNTTTSDVTAFFGQQANALDRVSTEFARAVASAIFEAF